jgi:hypothetical protein
MSPWTVQSNKEKAQQTLNLESSRKDIGYLIESVLKTQNSFVDDIWPKRDHAPVVVFAERFYAKTRIYAQLLQAAPEWATGAVDLDQRQTPGAPLPGPGRGEAFTPAPLLVTVHRAFRHAPDLLVHRVPASEIRPGFPGLRSLAWLSVPQGSLALCAPGELGSLCLRGAWLSVPQGSTEAVPPCLRGARLRPGHNAGGAAYKPS